MRPDQLASMAFAQSAMMAAQRAQSLGAAFHIGIISSRDPETYRLGVESKGWGAIEGVVNPAGYDEGQPIIMLLVGGDRNMAMPIAFSPYQTGEIV